MNVACLLLTDQNFILNRGKDCCNRLTLELSVTRQNAYFSFTYNASSTALFHLVMMPCGKCSFHRLSELRREGGGARCLPLRETHRLAHIRLARIWPPSNYKRDGALQSNKGYLASSDSFCWGFSLVFQGEKWLLNDWNS